MRRAHGLALIELATASLVASIVVVGFPAYQTVVMREIVEEVIVTAAPMKRVIQQYASRQGRLPGVEAVTVPAVTSKYVASISWAPSGASGTVTLSTRSGHDSALDGKALVLTATYDALGRGVVWACAGAPGTTVPDIYLPTRCRSR